MAVARVGEQHRGMTPGGCLRPGDQRTEIGEVGRQDADQNGHREDEKDSRRRPRMAEDAMVISGVRGRRSEHRELGMQPPAC